MLRSRIIPCLLLQNNGLVKTFKFKDPKYVGDPINTIRIFNEKKADELLVLDINATARQTIPNFKLIEQLASECEMPLCYGGGIKTVEQASTLIRLGVEKLAISSALINNPDLIVDISQKIGRQSVIAVLDVKRTTEGNYQVFTHNGLINTNQCPIQLAALLQQKGIGEVVINSIDHDGMMVGYDLRLAQQIRECLDVPLTMLGGAGSLADMKQLINSLGIVGAAAGSLFVFKGQYKAVLITYPGREEKDQLTGSSSSVQVNNQYIGELATV